MQSKAPNKRNITYSRLHFSHSTEGLPPCRTNRALACISRTRHARSPQRVARVQDKSRSRLHFAHSTRAISAEGCPLPGQIALSPAFRALDTHDRRRGLHFRLTLFVPPSAAFKEILVFILTLACLHWDTYTCILALGYLHLHTCTWMLSLLHWDTYTIAYFHLQTCMWSSATVSIEVEVFKCKYRSVQ